VTGIRRLAVNRRRKFSWSMMSTVEAEHRLTARMILLSETVLVPNVPTVNAHRIGITDGVSELNFALRGETGGHDFFGPSDPC